MEKADNTDKIEGSISEFLKPTFENVSRTFITETMYNLSYNESLPHFQFEFREKEAKEFINNILQQYLKDYSQYDSLKQRAEKMIAILYQEKDGLKPVMVINDYKLFFENLRKYYEEDIKLYFQRTKSPLLPVYEQQNCFNEIWLRATPDDFNDPEKFLEKHVKMLKDNTFDKYNNETYLGKLKCLDNNIICIKNQIARTWDENSKEIAITIYDKNHYNDPQANNRLHYTLPLIRYGIYEKDGKKVCNIGSIQNKSSEEDKNSVYHKVERKKYSLNANISEEDITSIEPKNILALSIFINLLSEEGIENVEVPGMYVLDYEYHQRRSKLIMKQFQETWNEDEIKQFPEQYKFHLNAVSKTYNKEDLISELKTERLTRTFTRLMYHYPSSTIFAYPGEQDNFLHFQIPKIKNENEIKGDILKEIYQVINEKNQNLEK